MTTQPEALLRNRDNQRRSRARRKEYIQELEKRLLNSERAGVQATAEVQAAARKVVQENARLRALLKKHGVDQAEIEQYLVADGSSMSSISSEGTNPSTAYSASLGTPNPSSEVYLSHYSQRMPDDTPDVSLLPNANAPSPSGEQQACTLARGCCSPAAESPSVERQACTPDRGCCCPTAKSSSEICTSPESLSTTGLMHSPSPEPISISDEAMAISAFQVPSLPAEQRAGPLTRESPYGLGSSRQRYSKSQGFKPDTVLLDQQDSGAVVQRQQASEGVPTPSNDQRISSPAIDETSCENAAQIIASMRGHHDMEAVWPELGCSGPIHCTIKNVSLFQILDRSVW